MNTAFRYDRVVLLGVDGAGTFFRDTDTPNLDRIFRRGAVSYDVLTAAPTISAECWGSMLLGVTPGIHRLTNSIVSERPYNVDSDFPSVFRVIRENDPEAELASFCNWSPINRGIIENNLGVHKETGSDAEITEKICAYMAEHDPKFLFAQFDEVDGAGHRCGYGTRGHLDQITVTDGYVGRIYDAYERRGFLDGTLFLVTADHGGKERSHGGLSDTEKYVLYAAAGATVAPGTIGEMEIRDSASVVLHALGYDQPSAWTSRVPSGLFRGVTAGERPVYEIPFACAHRTHGRTASPEPSALAQRLGRDRIRAYLPLDGSVRDALGGSPTTQSGKLYFVDGYCGGGVRFDDGCVTLAGFAPEQSSFSVCLWMKTGGAAEDPCLFSNKDWTSGRKSGFVLSLAGGAIRFNAGDGEKRMDASFPLPLDYADGWVHIALVVDRGADQIRFAYDFGAFTAAEIPPELRDSSFSAFPCLNIGQDGTGNYPHRLSAVLDEFILTDGVLTEEDLAALAELYGAGK